MPVAFRSLFNLIDYINHRVIQAFGGKNRLSRLAEGQQIQGQVVNTRGDRLDFAPPFLDEFHLIVVDSHRDAVFAPFQAL